MGRVQFNTQLLISQISQLQMVRYQESEMSGKHYNWHKAWHKDLGGNLRHTSGLVVVVTSHDGYTDLIADEASLVICHASEQARGVPAHDLVARVRRLIKEAKLFWEYGN